MGSEDMSENTITDDVAPYEVVGGAPAEHIGWRFAAPVRERLQEIAWWEWDEERIADNSEWFGSDPTHASIPENHHADANRALREQ